METTSTVWKLVVFSVILSTGASDNNMCPKSYTDLLPVVHMCTDDNISQTESFLIDAFALATTATTCNCTLQATSYVQIGTSAVIAPYAPCDSEIHINTERDMTYTCGYGKENASRNVENDHISIQLKTVVSNKNATYCINIVKSAGEVPDLSNGITQFVKAIKDFNILCASAYLNIIGTLSIRCFSPYTNATPTTTPTTKDGPQTGTTTSVIPSPSSEHQQKTSSDTPVSPTAHTTHIGTTTPVIENKPSSEHQPKPSSNTPVSPTPDTTHIGTTTPVIENKPNSDHQQGSGSFPVAAAAGGAGGFVLIVVVVVIFVIFLKRKKQSKKSDDNPYENEVYVKSDTNPNYPPDPYSTIHDEGVSVPVNAMILEPKVPLKPDNLSSGDYDIISDQPVTASRALPKSPAPSAPPAPSDHTLTQSQKDELSNMYAKVNKIKPTKTQEDNDTIPQPNDVYAVVDKSKGKQAIKGEGSGDVYAVVQKKKTSAPKPPPGTPGLIYCDLAFDEDEDEDSPEGAVGGEVNSRVSTNEDSVTYSSVRVS